jgi:hypothetical protein
MTSPTPTGPPPPNPTPYLRRGPAPDRANGHRVVIVAFLIFLALVTFVVVLVVTIGLHNSGVKIPPGPAPHATQPS